jgi:drug/metabolite transporter (DMT)-like permease
MLLTSLLITGNDAVTKTLVAHLPAGEIILCQALLVLVATVLGSFWRGRAKAYRVASLRMQAVRSLCNAGSLVFFVAGLPHLTLSTATALAFASPLIVSAFAPLLINEPVDGKRTIAVLIGFGGILLVARPQMDFSLWVLLPLASALCAALREIVTRRLTATDASEATVLYSVTLVAVIGFIWAKDALVKPSMTEAAMLVAVSLLYLAAVYTLVEALRCGEAATIAPFRYSSLVWAAGCDLVFWGLSPAPHVIAGGAILVAAMIFIGWRQQARSRMSRDARTPSPDQCAQV